MTRTILRNGLVFSDNTFKKLDVAYSDGCITDISENISMTDNVIDCSGCYVLPGLTDIHLHGGAGADVCNGNSCSLDNIAEYEFSHGITTFCPTTMTLPDKQLSCVLQNIADYASKPPVQGKSEIVGIHLEGPFVSPEKCGAQKKDYIQKPSAEKLRSWQNTSNGMIKLVTIAPESDGALGLIRECANEFHFSVGHTNSNYSTATAAFNSGADHVTHLFNAMPAFHHRDTGVIGAAFDSNCFAEMICDGVHVSPTAVKAAFKLFGDDRIILVSDSMEAAGMPDGEYRLGGQKVIKNGKHATLSDNTLAGSVSNLYDCMLTAVKMGIPLESAVKAATINPCRSIGIDNKYGSIEIGKAAHFLVLSKNDLSIKCVV